MFSWFKKDPVAKLQTAYKSKLTEAMHAQRNGDIRAYSALTHEASLIKAELDALQTPSNTSIDTTNGH